LQQLCDRPGQLRHGPSQAAVSPVLRRRSRRTVAAMRRLILASATTALAFLRFFPPAWGGWTWPVRGEVITPYRNGTDPYASGQHRGIDIAAATGTTVVAATSGEVRFAGTAGSSGLTVSVRTADGRYDTSYLHLSSASVGEGDRVAAGQPLGAVGTTGTRSATEPHLHFGVRDAGSRHAYHDPLRFLPPPTATQPPRGAPAPEPAPVPISPGPAPVGAGGRAPAPAGGPGGGPTGAPRARPAGAPPRVPTAKPHRVAAGDAGRSPAGAPGFATSGTPHHEPVNPGGVSLRAPTADGAAAPHRPGPDLGLLAACLGLLAAAALLGLTGDGRKATRETRHRIARVLR